VALASVELPTIAQPPQTASTLIGRDAELARIAALLDGARASCSGALVIRGPAGAGKTALLEAARARADGMCVLESSSVESEVELPFAALHQLLRPLLDGIEALPEIQARALRGALGLGPSTTDHRFVVSVAVLSLLAEAAEERPVLCLVDDAHWLDDASAETLAFVARRLQAERVVVLFAARDGDARDFDAPKLPELHLPGLSRDAAAALLSRQAELSPDVREQLLDATRGNPLALLELEAGLTPRSGPAPSRCSLHCRSARGSSAPSSPVCAACPSPRRRCCWSPPPTAPAHCPSCSTPPSGSTSARRRSTSRSGPRSSA
jgi:predicted ATPase